MFTTSAVALLAASDAQAQDFPNFAAGSNWQGLYAGLHGGYGWGETDVTCLSGCSGSSSYDTDGEIGGAQIGYNWMLAGFLVGLEGDISFSAIEGDSIFGGKSVGSELDWMATLRARAGALVADHVLIYGTGGVAWGDWEDSFDGTSFSDVETGWTVGGGVETKVTEWVSLKAEYLYVDFGDKTHTFPSTDTIKFDHDDLHTVRVGFNVKLH